MTKVDDLEFLVLPKIKSGCGPLFITTSLEKAKDNILGNGSYTLVDTGEKKLLITCHHVWNEFKRLKSDNSEVKLCLALDRYHPVFLANLSPIDESESLDIITFDMTPYLSVCRGREFIKLNCNYSTPVRIGDALVVVGYPGIYRIESDEGIAFGRSPHVINASDVTATRIISDVTRVMNKQRVLNYQSGQQNPYGGISGGPCFSINKENYHVRLVGFVTEHVDFPTGKMNLLKSTSVRCLNGDGTIKHF